MEPFLQNTLFSFLLEVATLRGYSILLPQIEINGKNCKFFKQFTTLLKMVKKAGKKKKCLKLLNFCHLKNNYGNFQRHLVWMAFKLAMEISTVKIILRNIFLRHFSRNAKF